MKLTKLLFSGLLLILSQNSFSQAPDGVNYQAVVRNSFGLPLSSQAVAVRFSIHQGSPIGTVVFTETQPTTTNQFGLINLELGSANNIAFSAINWGTGGAYYLQIEVDAGSGFDDLGASQLLSVPYALFAKSAATGVQGFNSLIDTVSATAAECATGGYTVLTGLDANANTVLEPGEVAASFIVCDGSVGISINWQGSFSTAPAGNPNDAYYNSADGVSYIFNGTTSVWDTLAAGGAGGADNDWIIVGNDMSSGIIGNVGIGVLLPPKKLSIRSFSAGGDGIQINNASTGNPGLEFQTQGITQYVLGVDQTDNNKFKIGTSGVNVNTRFTIDNQGFVGIGTRVPGVKLHVADEAQTMVVAQSSHNLAADQAGTFSMVRSRGTIAIPTNVLSGDRLGKLEFVGWNSGLGLFEEVASIRVLSDEAYTGGSTASHMEFYVNPAGQTVDIEAMRIQGNGFIGIGTPFPNANLDVTGITETDSLRVLAGAGIAGDVLTSDASGNATWQAGGGDGNGIYTGSGSLSATTTVTQAANSITFNSTSTAGFNIVNNVLGNRVFTIQNITDGSPSYTAGSIGARIGVSAGGAQTATGIESRVTGTTSANKIGGWFSAEGTGTGWNRGVNVSAKNSTGSNFGIDVISNSNTGTNYGMRVNMGGTGTGTKYGLYITSIVATAGPTFGLYLNNSSSGTKYGVYSFGEDLNYFSGNVGIGTASPSYKLHLSTNSAAKPVSAVWTVVSDARLKTDISPYKGGLQDILNINPVWFTYNGKAGMPNETGVGVIAQDLQKIAPYMVNTWTFVEGSLDEDNPRTDGQKTDYLGVDNGAMTYMLINAVKEQQKQIEELKKEVEDLKNK